MGLVKAGKTIVVRAKNGDCIPMFRRGPEAYRCVVGSRRVSGTIVHTLMMRRLIVCVKPGWYTEGEFKFNDKLRDARGRFVLRNAA